MHLFTLPNGSDVQLERNSLLVSNHTYPNPDILAEIARVFPRRKTSKVIASINIERVIQFVRCIFPRYTSTLDPRNDHFKLQTDKWDGMGQISHYYNCSTDISVTVSLQQKEKYGEETESLQVISRGFLFTGHLRNKNQIP